MFSLPQPDHASDEPAADTASEAQVIDMSESSGTLDILLRLIYPIEPPRFPGISEAGVVEDGEALVAGISPLLAAALKYDMHLVVKHLCTKLLDAAETMRPDGSVIDDTLALRVYVLACRHRLKEEARRAALASLKGRVTGVFVEDLRQINAAQYFRLIQFRENIVAAMESIVQKDNSSKSQLSGVLCSCSGHSDFAPWWQDFVSRALPVLRQSPKSEAVFSAAFLEPMFRIATNCKYLPSSYSAPKTSNCQQLPGKWNVTSQEIKESIDKAIAQNEIDLSEIY